MILSCSKTGRWWRVTNRAEAERIRWAHGLVDYEIGVEK